MLKAIESGQVGKLYDMWVNTKGSLCDPPDFQPVAFDNVFTPFVTLLLGIGSSGFIIALEWCHKRLTKTDPKEEIEYPEKTMFVKVF
jgi:hypothetical protein